MTAMLTEEDVRIREAVEHQLEWDPEVDASFVGVSAKDGAVALTGYIASYAGKIAAERAAKHIKGVRVVANDIEVRPSPARTDAGIAREVARALELQNSVPASVQATVEYGHVILTGAVPHLFQHGAAESAVRDIRGVRGVLNSIHVVPPAAAAGVQKRITAALHRNADLNAHKIVVAIADSVVTLTGEVRTWSEREAAERAATEAPGISRVENQIQIAPPADYL